MVLTAIINGIIHAGNSGILGEGLGVGVWLAGDVGEFVGFKEGVKVGVGVGIGVGEEVAVEKASVAYVAPVGLISLWLTKRNEE